MKFSIELVLVSDGGSDVHGVNVVCFTAHNGAVSITPKTRQLMKDVNALVNVR